MKNYLWVEKYRPKTLNDYIFKNKNFEEKIKEFIKCGEIPHLLLFGPPGTGKTTLAKILFNEIGIHEGDILEINASLENRIDVIRENIINFVTSRSFSDLRCVLLDEADYLSHSSQAALRNLMEKYSETSRFVLTANYPHKIIPAIKSRCQQLNIDHLDEEQFLMKGIEILEQENINYDENALVKIFEQSFPDLRKFINNLQLYSINGTLKEPSEEDLKSEKDWYFEVLKKFQKGQIYEARQSIIDNLSHEDYVDFYRFCYDNREILIGNSREKEFDLILLIKQYLVDHSICADPEINLSAFLVELTRLIKS